MKKNYSIVFKGELLEGYDRAKTIASLATAMDRDEIFVEGLFTKELKTLRAGMDANEAGRYVKALAKLGVKVYVVDLDAIMQERQRRQAEEGKNASAAGAGSAPSSAAEPAEKASEAAEVVEEPAADDGPEVGEVVEEVEPGDADGDVDVVEDSQPEYSEEEIEFVGGDDAGGEVIEASADESGASEEIEEIEVGAEVEEIEEGAEASEDLVAESTPDEGAEEGDDISELMSSLEEKSPEVVDGVDVGKSKVMAMESAPQSAPDLPVVEADASQFEDAPDKLAHNYDKVVDLSTPPKYLLPSEATDEEIDQLSMSEIGDEGIETLHVEHNTPQPDIAGLELASEETARDPD